MTIWLTSDTHFGHQGIVETAARPFADVRAMDDGLIQIWNSLVQPRDVVWHLGDFAHGPKGTAAKAFRRLNGTKHLVRGNHDGDEAEACPWASVVDVAQLKVDGVRLVLSHYPMLSWPGSARNADGHVHSIMCHGHVHGRPGDPRVPHVDLQRCDVGVDMRSMAPINAQTLVAQVRAAVARTVEHGTYSRAGYLPGAVRENES